MGQIFHSNNQRKNTASQTMTSRLQERVNQIMHESTNPYLLTEDVVKRLRSKHNRDYSRKKDKEFTRNVTAAVSTYRQKIKDKAQAAGPSSCHSSQQSNGGDDSDEEAIAARERAKPKFNLLNANMRQRYASTKASATTNSTTTTTSSTTTSATSSSTNRSSNANSPSPADSSTADTTSSKRSRKNREDRTRSSGKRRRTSDSGSSSSSSSSGAGASGEDGESTYHTESTGRYSDLGGIEKCLQDVRELIES